MLLAMTGGKVVFTGFCLGIGIWGAKKVTNRLDEFIFEHSKKFQKLIDEERAKIKKAQERASQTENEAACCL